MSEDNEDYDRGYNDGRAEYLDENEHLKERIKELEQLNENLSEIGGKYLNEADLMLGKINELEGQVKYLDDLDDTHIALILKLKSGMENSPWKVM